MVMIVDPLEKFLKCGICLFPKPLPIEAFRQQTKSKVGLRGQAKSLLEHVELSS